VTMDVERRECAAPAVGLQQDRAAPLLAQSASAVPLQAKAQIAMDDAGNARCGDQGPPCGPPNLASVAPSR